MVPITYVFSYYTESLSLAVKAQVFGDGTGKRDYRNSGGGDAGRRSAVTEERVSGKRHGERQRNGGLAAAQGGICDPSMQACPLGNALLWWRGPMAN